MLMVTITSADQTLFEVHFFGPKKFKLISITEVKLAYAFTLSVEITRFFWKRYYLFVFSGENQHSAMNGAER